MTNLRIGDEAPDFEANTTQGPIKFHDTGRQAKCRHPRS